MAEASSRDRLTPRFPNIANGACSSMNGKVRREVIVAATVVLAIGVGAIALGAFAPDSNQVCDGVQRTLGGCDANQPTFVGDSCSEVGAEFGAQLDRRIVDILRGAEVVEGQAKSARVSAAEFLLTARANQHLRRIGIVADCRADEFLAAAEPHFSDELKAGLGPALSQFQDHPYTYEEWRVDLLQTLSAIDMDEDEPA